jgi:hypothetical protein
MVDGALINGQATTPKAGMHEYAYKHAMVCMLFFNFISPAVKEVHVIIVPVLVVYICQTGQLVSITPK